MGAQAARGQRQLARVERLDELPTVDGQGHWPKVQLTGATAARAEPALAGLNTLWVYYSLIRDTIRRARKSRGSISSVLPSKNILGEIERLLRGPSIELPAVATPLEQRNLLTSAEVAERVQPERLLAAMNQLFEQGRDMVLAIGAAWDELPHQIVEFEAELAGLAAQEGSFPGEITSARKHLAELLQHFDTDPLTAMNGTSALQSQLQAIRERADQLATARQRVSQDLLSAHRLLAEAVQTQHEAAATFAECNFKVRSDQAAPLPCPLGDEQIAALQSWLVKLDTEVAAGRWLPVRVGIERWNTAARQYVDANRESHRASKVLLDQPRFAWAPGRAQSQGRGQRPCRGSGACRAGVCSRGFAGAMSNTA